MLCSDLPLAGVHALVCVPWGPGEGGYEGDSKTVYVNQSSGLACLLCCHCLSTARSANNVRQGLGSSSTRSEVSPPRAQDSVP